MPTTTPKKITGHVLSLCRLILPAGRPVFVDIQPDPTGQERDCFWNVKTVVERSGGRMAYGWSLWIWPDVFAEAEHHAVWERPDGSLVDVTPNQAADRRILFLRDDASLFDFDSGKRRDNVRMPLTSDPLVKELLDSTAAEQAFIETKEVVDGRVSLDRDEWSPFVVRRLAALQALYWRYLKPSDRCTCGSGRQVRRCCGLAKASMLMPLADGPL